jgi:hypothetical protein
MRAGTVAHKRSRTGGSVEVAGCVVMERQITSRRVIFTGSVGLQRARPKGAVVMTGRIGKERERAERTVVGPLPERGVSIVGKERILAHGSVHNAGNVSEERTGTDGCIEGTFCVVKESEGPIDRVVFAHAVTQTRASASSRIFICVVQCDGPSANAGY